MAGAKTLQANASPQFMQALEHLHGKFRIVHDQGFRDFELQRAGQDGRACQHALHIMQQIVTQQLT